MDENITSIDPETSDKKRKLPTLVILIFLLVAVCIISTALYLYTKKDSLPVSEANNSLETEAEVEEESVFAPDTGPEYTTNLGAFRDKVAVVKSIGINTVNLEVEGKEYVFRVPDPADPGTYPPEDDTTLMIIDIDLQTGLALEDAPRLITSNDIGNHVIFRRMTLFRGETNYWFALVKE